MPITLSVWNRAEEARELEVAYSVTNGDGGRVAEGREDLTFGPQRVTPFTFTVRPRKPGTYHVAVELQGVEVDLTRTLDLEVEG